MRNTLALGIVILGAIIMISAVKNWKLATTLQVVTGQKPWDSPADGGGADGAAGGLGGRTIDGTPSANAKDRPGFRSEDLEKNPDGSWKRDSDGYIIIKPGAKPFDYAQANANRKPGEAEWKEPLNKLQDNAELRRNIARF